MATAHGGAIVIQANAARLKESINVPRTGLEGTVQPIGESDFIVCHCDA